MFYIIRSIFISASDTALSAARQLLAPQLAAAETEKKDTSTAPVRRGRRRGAVVEEQPQSVDKAKELQAKWQEELERREKSLPFHQRSGYGDVKLAGDSDYRAVFDIEYIELAATN